MKFLRDELFYIFLVTTALMAMMAITVVFIKRKDQDTPMVEPSFSGESYQDDGTLHFHDPEVGIGETLATLEWFPETLTIEITHSGQVQIIEIVVGEL